MGGGDSIVVLIFLVRSWILWSTTITRLPEKSRNTGANDGSLQLPPRAAAHESSEDQEQTGGFQKVSCFKMTWKALVYATGAFPFGFSIFGRAVDMNPLIVYTLNRIGEKIRSANLENERSHHPCTESEDTMSINKKKIRREVVLNGVKVWVTADSEQEYADKLLRLAGASSTNSGEKHPFKAYAERWFEVFSRPNVASVTALTYERQLVNYIFPVLGGMNVEDIRSADVQKVFNGMADNAKQETKNKVKIVLNQVFKMALDDGLIHKNPLQSSSVKIKGSAASATEPYSVEQMRHLAAHLDDVRRPMDKAWLALSISLPLRPEEVLGLKWEDVDLDACSIHVHNTVTHPTRNEPEFKPYPKTASSVRDLTFPREILAYLPEPGRPDEFVVGGERAVSYTQLRGIRKRVNLDTHFGETITPRRFRTTVATDISAMTHDLKLVQQMLGHATPQMTLKHYDKGRSGAIDASQAIGKCYGFGAN